MSGDGTSLVPTLTMAATGGSLGASGFFGADYVLKPLVSAAGLREFVDGALPQFAKCQHADVVIGGPHRWITGHDLGINILPTMKKHGVVETARHVGHIVLTDFPTVDGIPIPFLSQEALGSILTDAGISTKWLSLNLWETGTGLLGMVDASSDVLAAFWGSMVMDHLTFLEVLAKVAVEFGLGCYWHNPLLLVAGVEEILAAAAATWKTYAVSVSLERLLAAALPSMAIAGALAWYLGRHKKDDERIKLTLSTMARAGVVSTCFAVKACFGWGAIVWVISMGAGTMLAASTKAYVASLMSMSPRAYELYLQDRLVPFDTTGPSMDCRIEVFSDRPDGFQLQTLDETCLRTDLPPLASNAKLLRADIQSL